MIYLNNAGTSWPKPPGVSQAMDNFQQLSPEAWNQTMEEDIKKVVSFFNIDAPERLLLMQGCSSAMALVMTDFDWKPGDRLLISSMEHHALSRWFHKLQAERGVEGVMIPRAADGPIDLDILEHELKKGARMVATSMAANVTGEILPNAEIISLSRQYGARCFLDGAQAAGIIPIDIAALQPDFFVFAGHKGPLGPKGIGGLYIAPDVPMVCPSAACNIDSSQPKQSTMPSYCDVGSLNGMALAGLVAGMAWIEETGWASLTAKRHALVEKMLDGFAGIDNIKILGSGNASARTGAVAVSIDGYTTNHVAQQLAEHGIIVGSGFQCAPHAHEAVGTAESGCLRFGVGVFSKEEEIDRMVGLLGGIVGG